MSQEDNDIFLGDVSKLQEHTEEAGWIKITLKRDTHSKLQDDENMKKFKPRKRSDKKIIQEKLLQQYAENPDQNYDLRYKLQDNYKNRGTTLVNGEQPRDFTKSLINVFRLHFFKNLQNQSKKIQKEPTKADSQSKTSLKKQERRIKNRECRQKRNKLKQQDKREKQRALNQKLKQNKMEIEQQQQE